MHTPATDALRAHLTTPMGSPLSTTRIPPLMVPGENPNARNTEVVFLTVSIITWPHPYNNNQTPSSPAASPHSVIGSSTLRWRTSRTSAINATNATACGEPTTNAGPTSPTTTPSDTSGDTT
ncbi:hypothetical protein MAUB_65250 (plasmid) [Mycolicibacterium aubagnense]|uniref:Uncharacterized protein n=2 Tax=Mycolicibacterium aubagnense TaxID=319707 RepID=A0ABN5Z5M0_9MYCO|nr:hypothetical protein MAUB_65250 [Mycolicibacterium aubagnense]